MTTESNMVASCQGWPPRASGMTPAALALSSSARNSSKVFGSVPPILSISALLSQIQLTEWMLMGTAPHLPLVVVNLLQRLGKDLVPAFLLGERGDVREVACIRVVDGVVAEDLRGGRRIAGGHHRF